MTHIAIKQREDGVYDLQLTDNGLEQLQTEDDLRTLVLASILTEARATAAEAPDPTSLGGYWGDTYADHTLGSRVWTLQRQKITAPSLSMLETFVRECLQWLLDTDVVERLDVTIERPDTYSDRVHARVVLLRPGNPTPETVLLWSGL